MSIFRAPQEPMVTQHITTRNDAIDDGDVLVHDWRSSQLQRLGIPEWVSEFYADLVDWHQVARLVQCGCPPRLALHIIS
jgi:hypothetical protein